jgi:PIN domain nuclease of toxin-antitoxin system
MICVMDASALLALIQGERGSEVVDDLIEQHDCVASSVNAAEVGAKLIDIGLPAAHLERVLRELNVDIVDFSLEQARTSALMRPGTRPAGLSLGDRACLALAQHLQATAVTADSAWIDVAQAVGVKVLMIR